MRKSEHCRFVGAQVGWSRDGRKRGGERGGERGSSRVEWTVLGSVFNLLQTGAGVDAVTVIRVIRVIRECVTLRCIEGERGEQEASHRKHTDRANWRKRGGDLK